MPAIEIVAKKREALPIRLVGKDYTIQTPKAALAMKMAIRAKQADNDPEALMEAVNDWLVGAFGKKDAAAIQKRLENPVDDLDFPDISELMQKVIEQGSENPTM